MRHYILLVIGLLLFASCEKEENLPNPGFCNDGYFYYSRGSQIHFKHSLDELWIDFEDEDIAAVEATSILKKYSFIDLEDLSSGSSYDGLIVSLVQKSNCAGFRDLLKELNKDPKILSATPIFYTAANNPDSYMILLSEVLTKFNEDVISEADFIDYAESNNLELIESKGSMQYFRVKDVETGFEALEIANQIYENTNSQFAHPNFIAKIELFQKNQ